MRLLPHGRFRTRRLCRLGVAVLLILANLFSSTGFPTQVFAATARKDLSVPFPCMNHPCGCVSAEQCWRGSCCCMTMAEKLAWADAHAVVPPSFVPLAPKPSKPASAGCSKCCQTEKPKPIEQPWVLILEARKCQNHGPLAVFAVAVATPPPPAVLPEFTMAADTSLTFAHEHGRAISHRPVVPPPRLRTHI